LLSRGRLFSATLAAAALLDKVVDDGDDRFTTVKELLLFLLFPLFDITLSLHSFYKVQTEEQQTDGPKTAPLRV
jgi:hypothetical protein